MKIPVGKAAQEPGVAPRTLRKWEKKGLIPAERSPGGHRLYERAGLQAAVTNRKSCRVTPKRKTTGCAGVSTSAGKSNLETQKQVMELYCAAKGWEYTIIEDIGSGLDYRKKGLQELIRLIEISQAKRVVVNYKNRLLCFGTERIEMMCKAHQTELAAISDDESKSYEEESAEDVLSIITAFSAGLYGSRSHKNKKIVEENKKLFNVKSDQE